MKLRDLKDKVAEFIAEQAGSIVPGEQKAKAAAKRLAEWLDEQIEFGSGPIGRAFEAIDGPALKAVALLIVQLTYNELKAEGRV